MSMFCYQCQEAAKGVACTVRGVCGKPEDVANLQDLLIYTAKGVALHRLEAQKHQWDTAAADKYIQDSLFATITNANFDADDMTARIQEGLALRDRLRSDLKQAGADLPEHDAAVWAEQDKQGMAAKATAVGILQTDDQDIRSLRELIVYGLKGTAAYHTHAQHLGYSNEAVLDFMSKGLAATLDDSLDADTLTGLVLETGQHGVEAMAILDKAHTESYGNPEMTTVNLGVRNNPAILISGHDLKDMEQLLQQTEGTGVDVYTHSEMLPAHYYPAFKKYGHFVGNYGNSWWLQNREFESFNGPILMTTNCITPPKDSYIHRMYGTGVTGYPGMKQVPVKNDGRKDFTEIIAHAKRLPAPASLEEGELVGGFAHSQVLSLADKVVEAVQNGAVRRFFVMAGCDGRMNDRQYYTEFARKLPEDTIILTAGCAKYRYNKLDLGDIGGIPRVLDAGQCNDSYSLAVVALKLKEVLGLDDVNELPISYNIAWYEQKAVIVLLALLSLGVKNIHLGPTLPAFLSENVAHVLVDKFGLSGIGTVDEDLQYFLG